MQDIEKVYEEYFETVYKYLFCLTHNSDLSEELTQETFYTAYKKQDELWKHPNPRFRLMRIAKYKMMEFRKYMRYRNAEPWEAERFELSEEDSGYGMKELDVTAESTLSEKEWLLNKKYYLFGVTISELAEAEGITENNMRVKLYRWTKRLRSRIDG